MSTQTTGDRTGPPPAAVPPPPRWARWAAHAVPLCALPSGLWRAAMAVGIPVGFSAEVLRSDYDVPGWGSFYVIGLAVAIEALALLTLGLVRPWGETPPRWVPLFGGKPVNPRMVVAVAGAGAVLITLITLTQLVMWQHVDGGNLTGAARTVMGLAYAPLLAWGPLLAAVTWSYHRRHRGPRRG